MNTQVNEPPTLPGLRNITIWVLIYFQPYVPSLSISSEIVMKKTIYAFQQGAFHYKLVNILQLLEMISVCFAISHRSTQIAVHTTWTNLTPKLFRSIEIYNTEARFE